MKSARASADLGVEMVSYTFAISYLRKELVKCSNSEVMRKTVIHVKNTVSSTGVVLETDMADLLDALESGQKNNSDLKPLYPEASPDKHMKVSADSDLSDVNADACLGCKTSWKAVSEKKPSSSTSASKPDSGAAAEPAPSSSSKRSLAAQLRDRKRAKTA